MTAAWAEKLLDAVLDAAMCQDKGCWASGYQTHFLENNYGFTYSAWPVVSDDDGDYDAANFEFQAALAAIGFATPLRSMRFDYDFSLFSISWVEPDSGYVMTLNIFIDPPDEDLYVEVLQQQLNELAGTSQGSKALALRTIDQILDKVNVATSKASKAQLQPHTLCDVLTLARLRVDESQVANLTASEAYAGFDWASAQVFGEPHALVGASPPEWVQKLERIIG